MRWKRMITACVVLAASAVQTATAVEHPYAQSPSSAGSDTDRKSGKAAEHQGERDQSQAASGHQGAPVDRDREREEHDHDHEQD